MKFQQRILLALLFILIQTVQGYSEDNLIINPSFEDVDLDGAVGDAWGAFGAAGFNDFFGGNPHASLFADNIGNFGGVFQVGIPADPDAVSYTFTLEDVRLEENIDCNARFGLEYFQADDSTLIFEDLVQIDLSTTGDGLRFSMTSDAVAGAAFVRPIIRFDEVVSTADSQENCFVFNTSLCANSKAVVLGDVNMDGVVDLLDVAPFVDLISTGGFSPQADINMDGQVTLLDVDPFVNILTGG